jgi:transcription elongation factor Elf1
MAMSDYMLCDRCGRKAYYDSSVDYGECEVAALCGTCRQTHYLAVVARPAPPERGDRA